MSDTQGRTERTYALFQPSVYSAGVKGYPEEGRMPPAGIVPAYGFWDSAFELTEQALYDQQSEPKTNVWYYYAKEMADPGGLDHMYGALKSVSTLKDAAEMGRPAATNAGARLKAAYWLGVAGRACARLSSGRSRLLSLAQAWAEQGKQEGLARGSIYNTNHAASIYKSAIDSIRSMSKDQDPIAAQNGVFQQVENILLHGTTNEGQKTAQSDLAAAKSSAEQLNAYDEEQKRKEAETPCEETWAGRYIPNYCEFKTVWKIIGYTAIGVTGLVAARVMYTQIRKTAHVVAGKE